MQIHEVQSAKLDRAINSNSTLHSRALAYGIHCPSNLYENKYVFNALIVALME